MWQLGEHERTMHLQTLVEKTNDYIEIQQADQKLHKMEEIARVIHEAMLSMARSCPYLELLWASLNKAKGLKSAAIQLKPDKVINYI